MLDDTPRSWLRQIFGTTATTSGFGWTEEPMIVGHSFGSFAADKRSSNGRECTHCLYGASCRTGSSRRDEPLSSVGSTHHGGAQQATRSASTMVRMTSCMQRHEHEVDILVRRRLQSGHRQLAHKQRTRRGLYVCVCRGLQSGPRSLALRKGGRSTCSRP